MYLCCNVCICNSFVIHVFFLEIDFLSDCLFFLYPGGRGCENLRGSVAGWAPMAPAAGRRPSPRPCPAGPAACWRMGLSRAARSSGVCWLSWHTFLGLTRTCQDCTFGVIFHFGKEDLQAFFLFVARCWNLGSISAAFRTELG